MPRIRAIDVVRFNYPTYLTAALVVLAAVVALVAVELPDPARLGVAAGGAGAGWWLIASTAAAAWVFDRPEYGSFAWVGDMVDRAEGSWLNVTAGFDATTNQLRRILPAERGSAIDMFDSAERHDGPLLRARRSRPPARASVSPADSIALEDDSVQTVTMLMSAHELEDDLPSVLAQLARILAPGGRLVIAEFLRSPLNLIVFGPGGLHFRTRGEWLRSLEESGFTLVVDRSVTPFVGVFVATSPTSGETAGSQRR